MQVVWFKRDLRISDNGALAHASDKTLLLYILEPCLWQQPDLSARHYYFLIDCLKDLKHNLAEHGLRLVIRVGNAEEVLNAINVTSPISKLISHQETWNYWTFQRDLKVQAWCKHNNITWQEIPQNGVIRRLKDRDAWAASWQKHMYANCWQMPKINSIDLPSDAIPKPEKLGLPTDHCTQRQPGGQRRAEQLLSCFLNKESEYYAKHISSPLTAYKSCSRLSTHLAFGTISIRTVVQQTSKRIIALGSNKYWRKSLHAFMSRLHWHCHFIQKLESQPEIEFNNMHSAYDKLQRNINHEYLLAWQTGNTGFPMIDACMRSLITTGWLNFRMRAMLISFASHHLCLPWRETGLHLARLFTDYEPGIHWSQVQMQSGTTGINSIRIYSPYKQSIDQDPKGDFLRMWLPELQSIPDEFIHAPWGFTPVDYPKPIVDEKIARKFAADQLYSLRKSYAHKQESAQVYKKHGSRKRQKPDKGQQGELPI